MINIIYFNCLFVVVLVLLRFYKFLPKSDANIYVYKRLQLKPRKINFTNFTTMFAFSEYRIVILKDASINIIKHNTKLMTINFNLDMQKLSYYTLNSNYTKFVFSDTCLYIDKNGIKVNSKYGILMTITKPKDIKFTTNLHDTIFCIGDKKRIGVCSTDKTSVVNRNNSIEFGFSNKDINLLWLNELSKINNKERQNLERILFGSINTTHFNCKKLIYNNNLQRNLYIGKQFDTSNFIINTNIYEYNYAQNVIIDDFYILLNSKNIKINLNELGFSKILNIKSCKNIIKVEDCASGYCVFFKFHTKVLHCELFCYFTENWLMVDLLRISGVEFVPFCLDFDCYKLTSNINGVLHNIDKKYNILYSKPNSYSIDSILEMVNRTLLQGIDIDIDKILKHLYIPNLNVRTQFLIANLLLTFVEVKNNQQVLYNTLVQNFLIKQCHYFDKMSSGYVRCYINKIIPFIKNDSVSQVMQNFLDNTKNVKDYKCWEYVYSEILGLKLNGQNLVFNWVNDSQYCLNTTIYGKQIYITKKFGTKNIFCNNIKFVDFNSINIFKSDKFYIKSY